jgi:hypothetical protein
LEAINEPDIGEPNNNNANPTLISVNEVIRAFVGLGDDQIDYYQVIPPADGIMYLSVRNLNSSDIIHGDIDQVSIRENWNSPAIVTAYSGQEWIGQPSYENYFFAPQGFAESASFPVAAGQPYYFSVKPDFPLDAAYYEVRIIFEEN